MDMGAVRPSARRRRGAGKTETDNLQLFRLIWNIYTVASFLQAMDNGLQPEKWFLSQERNHYDGESRECHRPCH